ncbi:MAG: Gfo/Idh/MocA family oxidoreductase [Bifidobacteriaceae bacterium]|jgi:predicted dehydrogenase|nr:Gfo/Idh/MocA family oxidoreductase [Bifidobacteriaceae bacterium]
MTTGLRWGILATGWIADVVTGDLLANGMTVTAVGSRDEARAAEFAQRHGIGSAYGSYRELATAPDVDVVYVATPHPFHAQGALLALDAGKHVLVEKPFALNQPEAAAIAERARERGLVALEAMWTRYLPHMIRVRELVASGVLGEIRAVFADHGQKLSTDPHHRIMDPLLGGGALLDLGIYPLSFAWDILGAPEHIDAVATPSATGVDRQTAILLTYPTGAQAVLHAVADAASATTASVIGTDARIDIDPIWYNPANFTLRAPDGTAIERFVSPAIAGSGRHLQALALERIVASGELEGPELPLTESVAIMGTLDAIRRQIGLRYPGE